MDLAATVYASSADFPADERFGLTSQMRRSAVSIPSNIAEGNARRSRQDYVRFLHIARGSTAELETQVLLAQRLGYLADPDELLDLMSRCHRLLNGLIRALTHD